MARRICEHCPRWVEDHEYKEGHGMRCPTCDNATRGRPAFTIRTKVEADTSRHTLEGRALHDGTRVEYLMAGKSWEPAVVRLKPWSGGSKRTSPVVYALPGEQADVSHNPVRLARAV